MGSIAQIEFDGFPASAQQVEKSDFQLYRELSSKDGGLIPQALLSGVLGISNARVSQLVTSHRFVVHTIGGSNYVTGNSFEAFLQEERRTGTHRKAPTLRQMASAMVETIGEIRKQKRGRPRKST